MKPSFCSLLYREISDLFRDPWLFSVVSWIPLLLYGLMWWIFSAGLAMDIPIGVVDLDRSSISRALVRHYEASPSLTVSDHFLDIHQGSRALKSGKIYALVVLPADLEKLTKRGLPPQVTAFVNSQYLLIGRVVSTALLQAQGTYTTRVEVMKNLTLAPPVIDHALSAALPIATQTTPLFNSGKNYAQFLVSAILPAIWQIVMIIATILSLAFVRRTYSVSTWLGTAPVRSMLSKMFFLGSLFLLHGIFFFSFMYVFLGWPMHGNWQIIILGQILTILASFSVASIIFFLAGDTVRCMSLSAAYAAPALAFMGVTFPVSDMTLPALLWRKLIPVNHYIEIQFAQVNDGIVSAAALLPLKNLLFFLLPFCFMLYLAHRLSAKQSVSKKEPV